MKTYGTLILSATWQLAAVPHVAMRVKRIFESIAKDQHGVIQIPDTPGNARDLLWFLERYPMEISEGDLAQLRHRAAFHAEQVLAVERIVARGDSDRIFPLAIPARDYQKVAADITLTTGRLLIADDVGLGKTAQGICVATDPRARPMLVVTLTHLTRQWKSEFERFAPSLRVHVAKKGKPYALDIARGKPCPPPDVLIMNYQKLTGWADTLAGHIKGIVFDEAQELRHTGSLKYSAARHIAAGTDIRCMTTATPIFNYGGEIYNLLSILAPAEVGSRAEFVREWCVVGGDEKKTMLKDPKAFGDWMRDEGLMIRRTRADVRRELPPLTTIPHFIDANLEEIDKIASSAVDLAKIILDVSGSGFAKMKAAEELDWRLRQATGIAKAPYTAEFVRILCESGEKVLLFTWHHAVNAILMERLAGLNPALYTGEESATQKAASFAAFTKGDAQVLIMSLRAGAGLDGIQASCRTVVFGELDWSPAVHHQCMGRPHRDGQTDPVAAYFLICEGGSDPVIADVLGIKKRQLEGIVDQKADAVGVQIDPGRIKRLAEAFLDRHQQRVEREAVRALEEAGQSVMNFEPAPKPPAA